MCLIFMMACWKASGGRDRFIHIWSVETNSWLHTFKGHRDAVSVSRSVFFKCVLAGSVKFSC